MTLTCIPLSPTHWPAVARIYQEGIDTGNATFETQPPASWELWIKSKIAECCLAALDGEQVVGWASLNRISARPVYAGVAELSIYVAASARRQGVGALLMRELIAVSEQHGIWTLQAGIFPENTASLQLHYRFGFRKIGVRQRIGRMEHGPYKGQWRDVTLLERRSLVVGI